jgi:hypothetical protein
MFNAVSSEIADPAGYVELPIIEFSTAAGNETRRRVNRVATLDGGAVLNDGGFSHADRTLELQWPSTDLALSESVERMAQLYTRVQVSVRSGVYLAALESFTPGAALSSLRLLVLSKLSS